MAGRSRPPGHSGLMPTDVSDAYDAMAQRYAALFLDALASDENAREWLAVFADRASKNQGPIADLGCGPGYVTDHLSRLGLDVVGSDISAGQISEARKAFPHARFEVGDLCHLEAGDDSIGGIVSRYSIIHLDPDHLEAAFREWIRVLEPGAPALVSFFAAVAPEDHGNPFDHKVTTAYALFPDTVAMHLEAAGFGAIEIGVIPPPDGGRPLDQGTVLAHKPSG